MSKAWLVGVTIYGLIYGVFYGLDHRTCTVGGHETNVLSPLFEGHCVDHPAPGVTVYTPVEDLWRQRKPHPLAPVLN